MNPQGLGRSARRALLALLLSAPAAAEEGPVSFGEVIKLKSAFATVETKATIPRGISGVACRSAPQGAHLCLAVNDEERFAAWALLQGGELSPNGKQLQLLTQSKSITDKIVGRMPVDLCDKAGKVGEFDGEAVALSGDYVYVTGSHACSREKGEFKPSAFLLARAKATGEAIVAADVERTWRVADVVRASPLAAAFGKAGETGAGIEGMAIIADQIYFGFRTPSIHGVATLLSAKIDELFAVGDAPYAGHPGVLQIALGTNIGIRDLAALDERHLLLLAGPAKTGDGAYVLHLVDVGTGKSVRLTELKTDQMGRTKGKQGQPGEPEPAKAEAISVLAKSADAVTLLVMYDNIDDGGPRLHRIALPK